jgi:hypothetical protein
MTDRLPKMLAVLLVFAAMGCAPFARAGEAANAAEQDKVVDAMRTMYVAATDDDLAKFHEVAAPDFLAFDGGMRFGGDELMALTQKLHAAGKIFHWEVTQPEVHIDGTMAWIAYVNQGWVEDASGRTEVTWLESAVLRKQNGDWRILFLHNTRAPAPAK